MFPGADDNRRFVSATASQQVLAGPLGQLPVVMGFLVEKYDMIARASTDGPSLRVHDLLQVLPSFRPTWLFGRRPTALYTVQSAFYADPVGEAESEAGVQPRRRDR